MVDTCAHCGAIIPLPPSVLTRTERRIYDFVAKRPGVTVDDIFDHMYSSRANGGPAGFNVINVFVGKINKKLSDHRIYVNHRGPGANYRLERK